MLHFPDPQLEPPFIQSPKRMPRGKTQPWSPSPHLTQLTKAAPPARPLSEANSRPEHLQRCLSGALATCIVWLCRLRTTASEGQLESSKSPTFNSHPHCPVPEGITSEQRYLSFTSPSATPDALHLQHTHSQAKMSDFVPPSGPPPPKVPEG